MIDIKLTDKNSNEIGRCGAGLGSDKELTVYLALRNALLDYEKLIYYFGDAGKPIKSCKECDLSGDTKKCYIR